MLPNQYFTRADGTLFYGGKPIDDSVVAMGRRLVQDQTVPDKREEYLFRSIAFVVTSQATSFERPFAFTRLLRNVPLEFLADETFMAEAAKAQGLGFGEDRYSSMYGFMRVQGGIGHAAELARVDPFGFREELLKAKYMQLKSASFLLFTWGIDAPYLILDVHHARQLAGLGLSIDERHHRRTIRRKSGKRVNASFNKKQYLETEHAAVELLRTFPILQDEEGDLDGRLTSAILWGAGAIGARGYNPHQVELVDAPVISVMKGTPFTPQDVTVKTREEALALFRRPARNGAAEQLYFLG